METSPFFMSESLRGYFIEKDQLYFETDDAERIIKDQYHTTFPLERTFSYLSHLCSLIQHYNTTISTWTNASVIESNNNTNNNNNNTFLYKAVHQETGESCVIRNDVIQIEKGDPKVVHHLSEERYEQLRGLKHAHIVPLRLVSCIQTISPQKTVQLEIFTVYNFIPQAISLESMFILDTKQPIEESLLWSILVQLLSIVKYLVSTNIWQPHMIHSFDPSKLLIIPQLLPNKPKLYWNGLGLTDIFLNNSLQNRNIWQQLSLICCSIMMNNNLFSKFDFIEDEESLNDMIENVLSNLESKYSPELMQLLREWFFIEEVELTRESVVQQSSKLVDKIEEERYYNEEWNNYLEDELTKELENGRLFRLLLKIQLANIKLDLNQNTTTSSTTTTSTTPHQEDLNILKLFSRYLLHPTASSVKIDYGHVVENLNRLDIGSEEKILLKDEQDLIVVKYSDLKKLLQ